MMNASATALADQGVHYRHVLVPIDGSERSALALRSARSLASRLDADVQTLGVSDDERELDHLRAVAADALETSPLDERIHVVAGGDPAQAIASLADELGSAIVCMSTHARGRFTGSVLGSTAREVLRLGGRPVLMIGPLADRPAFMGDAWSAAFEIGRVAVCVDAERSKAEVDSPGTAAATVDAAARWAIALGMTLTIVHVAAPVFPLSGDVGVADSNRWLAHLADGVSSLELAVDVHLELDPIGVVDGVHSSLVKRPAGLVVVAAHARSGMDRLLHGATAAGIAASSPIATLVLPVLAHSVPTSRSPFADHPGAPS